MNTIKFGFQTSWGANLFEKMLLFVPFANEIGTEEKGGLFIVSADVPDFSHYRDIEGQAKWILDHELEYDAMGDGK